ncbi:MAG: type IV pili methyl-accepting chemotaxis transducer N-terminal domain-containing protein, partial [Pantoea sp.]|nr:type IV pili methyl-accepting chemotaxis transducer N-terminal domain-containing protein [Pantoea sp.]
MIVKRSVTHSIAQALSAIVLLSLLTTGLALVTLFSSQRDAEAINLAGSLRMQSYRMAWDASSQPQQLPQHLVLFRQTLDAPVLQKLD